MLEYLDCKLGRRMTDALVPSPSLSLSLTLQVEDYKKDPLCYHQRARLMTAWQIHLVRGSTDWIMDHKCNGLACLRKLYHKLTEGVLMKHMPPIIPPDK
jgi:hypothetical protein